MKKFIVSILALASASAFASNYGADYSIKRTCLDQGPVKACRALQPIYNLAVLDIEYSGSLQNSDGLSIWVRVNYRDGSREAIFPIEVTYPRNIARARITGGCLVGRPGGCETSGTAQMRNLLQWAQNYSTLNALSVDLAFVDAQGNWDNNNRPYGAYHFDFAQD